MRGVKNIRIKENVLVGVGIAVPTLALLAFGSVILVHGWRESYNDEQSDLDSHAELYLASILGFADEMTRLDFDSDCSKENPPPDGRERRLPGAGMRPPPRPPNAPAMPWSREKRALLPGICRGFERVTMSSVGITAFEIVDSQGRRLYANATWPAKPGLCGAIPLAPPLGDGFLRTARADGGAAFRARNVRIVSVGALLLIFLIALLLSVATYILHLLRHERRNVQAKTDFIDNVSHELKTPLAGIHLNAELLSQNRVSSEEQRKGAFAAILVETDRLTGMIDNLLQFSRLEQGRYKYDIKKFNLAEFVDMQSERQAIAAISGGRASVSLKGKRTVVCADMGALRQIGINLVTNAVKYSSGPIDIEVDGCEIRYMDRGSGVPPDEEERIFERFHRVDNSLTRTAGGSGIGLSLARSLARGMGGDVSYSRREGGGSVFTLRLKPAEGS